MTDNNVLIRREALREKVNAFYDSHFKGLVPDELITFAKAVDDFIDNAQPVTTEDKEKEAYRRGFEIGKKIGARAERTITIAYLEGKTIEEDKIEQMFKNGEIEAIPYLGETAEEDPNV